MGPKNGTLPPSLYQGWAGSVLYSPVYHFMHVQDGHSPDEPRGCVHKSAQVLHTALTMICETDCFPCAFNYSVLLGKNILGHGKQCSALGAREQGGKL